jgi:hypothetical protein
MTRIVLVLVLVLAAFALVLVLDSPAAHAAPDRTTWISRALAAVHDLGPSGRDKLERDIYAAARTTCHAEVAPPVWRCLSDAAAALCKGAAACEAAADVIATNTRAASDWVDEATRAQLVRTSIDYRAALSAELHRRFGALAAELALAKTRDAAAIDRFCRERDRTLHACREDDPTCVPSVPWSRCVAALVWYVGSSGGTP